MPRSVQNTERTVMIVVDAHQDIAYNAESFGRDYRRSALVNRRLQAHHPDWPQPALGLPEALAGRVALTFATLFVSPAAASWEVPWKEKQYSTPQEAYRQALVQLDYYHRLADDDSRIGLVRTLGELESILGTWDDEKDIRDRKQGLVILMEGADPILEPRQFEEWYERGVRIVGPAWQATRYCAGTGAPGTLSDLGRDLLDIMATFNAMLDLSHMAELAFLESLDRYTGTVIASHSNPRRFRDTDRHLSDEMIQKLAERDGVMGIVLYNRFLKPDWARTDPKDVVTLQTVADAVDHVCQLTGSAAHVGIGSDLDGGFGSDRIPQELDTVADVVRLADVLRERGYSEADIEAIMGGNWLRKLRSVLPV
jgi:membrane dipeptidase